jgi:hypothetical protein
VGGTTGQILAKSSNTDYATQWVAPSGLELIKSQTIGTSVTSVEVTGAFSSTYDNYRIAISGGSGSISQDIGMRLGSTTTGYGYAINYQVYATTEDAIIRSGNAASWPYIFSSPGANGFTGIVDVQNPNLAKLTYMSHVRGTQTTSAFGGGYLSNTLQYTDFTLTPSSGTMTGGTIAVYGYKKA